MHIIWKTLQRGINIKRSHTAKDSISHSAAFCHLIGKAVNYCRCPLVASVRVNHKMSGSDVFVRHKADIFPDAFVLQLLYAPFHIAVIPILFHLELLN